MRLIATLLCLMLSGCAGFGEYAVRNISRPYQERQQQLQAMHQAGQLSDEEYARMSQEVFLEEQRAKQRAWRGMWSRPDVLIESN